MLEVFLASLNAVLPIILLIVTGFVLKRIKFINDGFIRTGNKLVFNILLPCMLFLNIYDGMSSFADVRWDAVIYAFLAILVIFCLGLLTALLSTKQKNRRGVILQCTFRSNYAIIGLSLVERLGGDSGIASIVSAFSIPVFNILAVIALTVFADNPQGEAAAKKISVKELLLNIIKNPLIIGVLAGLVVVAIREIERACCGGEVVFSLKDRLKFIYFAIYDLKLIASPLALIILGGQFEFSAVKGMTKEIVVATLWRVVIAPVLCIGCAVLLSTYTDIVSFGSDVYPTFVALFATPVAVSSAIMAVEMRADEQLAAQLVVWTSLCSIVTIFFAVFLLTACGLLTI